MWGNPTLLNLLTQPIRKSFLINPLTTNNAMHRDSTVSSWLFKAVMIKL